MSTHLKKRLQCYKYIRTSADIKSTILEQTFMSIAWIIIIIFFDRFLQLYTYIDPNFKHQSINKFYIFRQCMYKVVENYKIYLYKLQKQVEKQAFLSVSQRVQMSSYFQTMHVTIYCYYSAMLKSLKLQPNCLKRAETSIVLIVCDGILKTVQKLYTIYVNKEYFQSYFCTSQFQNVTYTIQYFFFNLNSILSEKHIKHMLYYMSVIIMNNNYFIYCTNTLKNTKIKCFK